MSSLKDLRGSGVALALFAMALVGVIGLHIAALISARPAQYQAGRAECVAQVATAAASAVQAQAAEAASAVQAQAAHVQATSRAHEVGRQAVHRVFNHLTEQADALPPLPAAAADCVLPADRLRLWAAANAGPGGGASAASAEAAAPGQPADPACGAACAGQRPDD